MNVQALLACKDNEKLVYSVESNAENKAKIKLIVHSLIKQSTGPGGKIMIIGMGTPIQTLPLSAAALREVDLVGVFRYANTYPEVISLLAGRTADSNLPDVGKLITQRFKGLDNITAAFDMASKVKDADGNLVLKVLVDMS